MFDARAMCWSWYEKLQNEFISIWIRIKRYANNGREQQAGETGTVLPEDDIPTDKTVLKSKVRRHYERQRRKFDEWVEPKGPKPAPTPRVPREPKGPVPSTMPGTPEPDIDDGKLLIVDVHHSDRKTEVLYEETEFHGQFNFRDTLLNQLDRYFFYLNRMRKYDKEAWHLYKQVGGVLVPYVASPDIRLPDDKKWIGGGKAELSPWFLATLPTFGCVAYGTSKETEKLEEERSSKKLECWVPRFLYFWKYDKRGLPGELQRIRGDATCYKLTVWWDHEKRMKWGRPQEYGVVVLPDGQVQVLKQLENKEYVIKRKGKLKRVGHRHDFTIMRREWCFPESLEHWAQTHGTTVQMYLSNIFIENCNRWEGANSSMVKLSICRGEDYACFGIDIHRLPYFFKDRDYVLTPSGHRKPIVHLVRPFKRKDGTMTKFQLRGMREFKWSDYAVKVTVPGLHHLQWEELDSKLWDEEKTDPKHGPYEDMKHLGKMIRDNIETGINPVTGE